MLLVGEKRDTQQRYIPAFNLAELISSSNSVVWIHHDDAHTSCVQQVYIANISRGYYIYIKGQLGKQYYYECINRCDVHVDKDTCMCYEPKNIKKNTNMFSSVPRLHNLKDPLDLKLVIFLNSYH